MISLEQAKAWAKAYNTEFKINFVPAKLPDTPILKNEHGERRGCDMVELLHLNLDYVENLYSFDQEANLFHLIYKDKTIAGFASCKVKPRRVRFDVRYDDRQFVEDGINFLGKIIVHHKSGESFYIRIMGERSYDPSGASGAVNGELIDSEFFSMYLGITVAEVRACMLGGDKEFVDSCQSVVRPINEKYYRRGMVHEWMGTQIKSAFFDKVQSPNLPHFLLTQVQSGIFSLEKGKHEHTMEYLESFLRKQKGESNETVIPRQFFNSIRERHSINLASSDLNEDEHDKLKNYTDKKVNPQNIALKLLPAYFAGSKKPKGKSLAHLKQRCDSLWASYATCVNEANIRVKEHKAQISLELPQRQNCGIF
mmetsp:Transcript_29360/g.52560  ORF Transcript_29360/g.52560 Transcript_29360/m.52560 type:complete len:367 (+) Transcript_29360:29-1129(+)